MTVMILSTEMIIMTEIMMSDDKRNPHDEDFPGEPVRVLKDKEIRNLGEYRTRRLVLEAWDGQGQG